MPLAYGAKGQTAGTGTAVPQMGTILNVQGGQNYYTDGAAASEVNQIAADAALPNQPALTDDDVFFLYKQRVAGQTWAASKAALVAIPLPSKLTPTDGAMEAWKAEIERRVAKAPWYPL